MKKLAAVRYLTLFRDFKLAPMNLTVLALTDVFAVLTSKIGFRMPKIKGSDVL